MPMRYVLFLVTATLLSSCASRSSPDGAAAPQKEKAVAPTREASEPARRVQPADSQAVANCKYLDTVQTSSSLYGVFAERGIKNARASAIEKAEALGGTHIVWEVLPQSYGSSQVAGKVYACKK